MSKKPRNMCMSRIVAFRTPAPGKNGATRPALDRVCGPATFTEAVVQDVRANGAPTGISYLSAVANLAAARIEEAARVGEGVTVQTKMAKTPSDVNVKIPEWAMRYITDNKRKVDVRGPVFLTVRAEIIE
jgi:O-phosphoseryl-tRNA synthetase